ncbi:MAG: glycosyltransferase family 39 protein [Candidatus Aminicenantes bacterium]|nr:glycosyltransferase family 39 protein [Candidatus Aminicenantes bacterium]
MAQLKNSSRIFLLLFLLGAWIRGLDVWRPVDGSVRESWRECDIASVARNFYQEGMNILYPRIDWRGDGPGFAEMEFPALPWTTALFYKLFGYNEIYGRVLVYVFSLLSLIVFFRLSAYMFEPFAAYVASTFFVMSPLIIKMSNSLQPEGLMIFLYILAVYSFLRWLEGNKGSWFSIAMLATSLCILFKVNSIHIGLLFLILLIKNRGFSALRDLKIWFFGLISLLPAVVWHLHARQFWLIYGNSLGVSNESHWIGLDILTKPIFFFKLANRELFNVWMPLGWIVALVALWFLRSRKDIKILYYWLLVLLFYFLVTIRTTGDSWAWYYHIVTVPAAALLFGAGADYLRSQVEKTKRLLLTFLFAVSVAFVLILARESGANLEGPIMQVTVAVLLPGVLALYFMMGKNRFEPSFLFAKSFKWNTLLAGGIVFCLTSTVMFQGYTNSRELHPDLNQNLFVCAQEFKSDIPDDSIIIASGGVSLDDTGRPVAFNAPYFFFWLNRKGFNVSKEDQSIDTVRALMNRGASYYILEKDALTDNPEFLSEMKEEFTLIKHCSIAYLFKLTSQ